LGVNGKKRRLLAGSMAVAADFAAAAAAAAVAAADAAAVAAAVVAATASAILCAGILIRTPRPLGTISSKDKCYI
jgi:hypothetical protein